jgi:hypothetical protein
LNKKLKENMTEEEIKAAKKAKSKARKAALKEAKNGNYDILD